MRSHKSHRRETAFKHLQGCNRALNRITLASIQRIVAGTWTGREMHVIQARKRAVRSAEDRACRVYGMEWS